MIVSSLLERQGQLDQELKRAQELIGQLKRENADIGDRLRSSELRGQSLTAEVQKLSEKQEEASDIENKLGLMIMENDKLLEINEERVNDIELLKSNLQRAELFLKEKNQEVEQWIRKYSNLMAEIEELKIQCENLRNTRESEIGFSQQDVTCDTGNTHQIMVLRDQLAVIEQHVEQQRKEIANLNEMLFERNKRIENLQQQLR